jgi:hypothetical protein
MASKDISLTPVLGTDVYEIEEEIGHGTFSEVQNSSSL